MKNFTIMKGFLSIAILVCISTSSLFAQTASISPENSTIWANATQNFTVTTTGFGSNNNNRTFVYTITGPGATIPSSPANFNCSSGCNTESHVIQFPTPGTYTVSVTVTQTQGGSAVANTSTTINVIAPNLYSTSGSGTIKAWAIDPINGSVIFGPADVFSPGQSTAALGKNQPNTHANDPLGYLYWLPNISNTGTVTVYARNPDGSGSSVNIASLDFTPDNTGLGFVRLAIDPFGWGWILAGNGSQLYLAKFEAKGTTATSIQIVNNSVNVSGGGSVADFQNGDLAFTANGVLYALANVTNGVTGIYTMDVASQTTTLNRKWTLTDGIGGQFSGSVNGVAFTQTGSLHISTSDGLYFIDQNSANQVSGTVNCVQILATSGLTDLASDKFPLQTTLPVKLLSFSGSLRNDISTLSWETENEENFSHFEIERSSDGFNFSLKGNKASLGQAGRSYYQFTDNLATITGNVFWYRLKIVDLDGSFKYSDVIMIRRDQKSLTGLIMNPNPVVNGIGTVRFTAQSQGLATFRIMDANGRLLLQQQSKITEGVNSVAINNLNKLEPGTYVIQMINGAEINTSRFIIIR